MLEIKNFTKWVLKFLFNNNNWNVKNRDIITSILPAGSITGTKEKTVEILNDIENMMEIFILEFLGVFDGENLDSAVMIRFIEVDEMVKFIYKKWWWNNPWPQM